MQGRSLSKKGIEVQFNWIFILIIGVLILAFFVVMVQKQREVANKKLAVNVLSEIDVILTGEGVATGRSDILEIPEMPFEFTCTSYSVAGIGRDTGNSIIFSPYNIESDTLLTWTLSWNMPYKIANFLYLTTPDITYYFVNVEDFIVDELPNNITVRKVKGINDIEPQGEDHIRIIATENIAGPLPSKLKGLPEEELTALVIGDDKLEFYKSDRESFVPDEFEGSNSYPALSKETLYGAVFANRFEEYKCTMDKAVKRWGKVNEIYIIRTEFLEGVHGDITDPCWVYYAGTEFITIGQIIGDGLQEGDADFITPTIRQLSATNDNTIFASCPELY